MKQAEINKIAMAGRSVLTGTLQRYKVEQTEKAGVVEKYGILIGDNVHDFPVWAAKGVSSDKIPRPPFVDAGKPVVAVIDATFKVDGKYLRTGGTGVVLVE